MRLKGELKDKNGNPSRFNYPKYAFFLDAPFNISDKCCHVMKKAPAHNYEKTTGRKPIIGTMTEESYLRLQKWLHEGCNAFDSKRPHSKPLSFWTEQDILKYIKENSIKICNIYGDIVPDYEAQGNIVNQIDFSDLGLCEDNKPLKTTGRRRTGCMFCGFGCHFEKCENSRFLQMKETHPQIYDYIMRPESEGGLNYREILSWINENGNLDIKF